MANAIDSFKIAMQSYGLNPPDTIRPGKFHRFPGVGKKRGDDAGWCKLFDDGRGGVFGDFSTGLDEHWQAENEHIYTIEERQAFRKRCEAESKAREVELRQQYEDGASNAAEIMAAAVGDPAQHPYALKKVVSLGVKVRRGAWSQRGWSDALLIPM